MELLTTVLNRAEADMIAGMLSSHSIKYMIKADDAGGVDPTLALFTGIKILVSSHDVERARTLIEN